MTHRRRSFPAALGVLAVLLAGGALYLWTLDRPWYKAGWPAAIATFLAGVSFVATVVPALPTIRAWLSRESQKGGKGTVRVLPVVFAAAVLGTTLTMQPRVGSGSSDRPAQATMSFGAEPHGAPSLNAGPSSSPAGEPTRAPTSVTVEPAPSSAVKVPIVTPTTPSPAPSGTRFSGTASGTTSSYLNLDVRPFTVADEPGTEQKFDLHVEPGQVTPMNNTIFGPQAAGEQCTATTDAANAYPFPPGRFCGTTRAGQSFVITIAHGDGNILNVMVELP